MLVSLPAEGTLTVPVFDTVLKGISIVGSIVGTRQDLAEVFARHALGRTRGISKPRDRGDVNSAVDEVLHGDVPARPVSDFESAG